MKAVSEEERSFAWFRDEGSGLGAWDLGVRSEGKRFVVWGLSSLRTTAELCMMRRGRILATLDCLRQMAVLS